jgi:hypothetical protein
MPIKTGGLITAEMKSYFIFYDSGLLDNLIVAAQYYIHALRCSLFCTRAIPRNETYCLTPHLHHDCLRELLYIFCVSK